MTKYAFGIALCIAAILIIYPNIDIQTSALFFKEGSFYLKRHPVLVAIHNATYYLTLLLGISYITALLLSQFKKNVYFSSKEIIYVILVLVVGPGLIVNTVFKEHWGRARPYQTTPFAGEKKFTPALFPSNQCQKNCSFSAGDPSVGFALVAFAFISRKRNKPYYIALSFFIGGLLGATRIAQGAHFLSDVIFSGIFTIGTAYILYKIMHFNNSEKTSSYSDSFFYHQNR